jgi:hypothetical protein
MRAAGAELDPSAFATYESPWITLKVCSVGSYVRARPTACVFVLSLRILGLVPKLILQGFELSSPAWPLNAYILDDPTVSNSACEFYHLLDGEKFYREEILNHRVEGEGRLGRGDVMEGLLLAESFDPVPSKYTDHTFMPLCLSIANQFDEVHKSTFGIQVERIPPRIQPRAERRSTLYDGADGSPGHPGSPVNAPDAVLPSRQPPERPVDCDADRCAQPEAPSLKGPPARLAGGEFQRRETGEGGKRRPVPVA